jgi:glyoxylase-like metal-dependent hydrolase (beta-lactamase superfamily II)
MKYAQWMLPALIVVAPVWADQPFTFEFEELAPGVWTGVRPDGPRFPVMGNATFIISDEGVVVFDGGGMPAMSEQLIDKIRSLTDEPVTHVITSHWHGDHNFGVFRFGEEFSDVQFLAHEFTRDVMNSSRINYVDRERGFLESNLEEFTRIVETGIDSEGNQRSDMERSVYQRMIDDGPVIDEEFIRAKVTPPNVVFTENYTIESGGRRIELMYLGDANTAGDIVMWLPEEKIVATGDIVVLPSPYAFNVPPRKWADTLRNINRLGYDVLVPGHGEVQRDSGYVDLLIESAETIADQRDALLAGGMSHEDVQAALDFSIFEEHFTHGDEYIKAYFEAWFANPFRAAAMNALTGEPMVAIPPAEVVPLDDERWDIEAEETERVDYLGQSAIRLKGGTAILGEVNVKNGLIEFDIAVSEERGFAGLVFRLQDDRNFEHFYIRPHQSGNPDANQYTPVFDGVSGWQLYYGEDYAAPVNYRFDEWMHVKIIYAGSKAEVYIDSDEPVLRVENLKRDDLDGAIGLQASNFASAWFSNFRYTKLANAYALPESGPDRDQISPGTITTWQISDAFDEQELRNVSRLGGDAMEARRWTPLDTEPTGIANLARVQGLGEGADTVFARYDVAADRPGLKMLEFGYSDAARVYLNGNLVYQGSNGYMSRDYRYLGTIGLFDSVLLPLEAGDNELCIAITEAFGGWGVMARITDFADSP